MKIAQSNMPSSYNFASNAEPSFSKQPRKAASQDRMQNLAGSNAATQH